MESKSTINIDDDSYIDHLRSVRKEENSLVERLIGERLYLSEVFRIDPLTGLYNRKILPKVREIGTVIMCDVDDFKTINDTFGHAIGDQALKAVGESITNNIRIGDIGCRFGGDEFLIVFTTDNREVIDSRMKKIVEDANKAFSYTGYQITMSIGIAFNTENEKLEPMMEKADTALYESKQAGKNRMTFYGEGTSQKVYKKEGNQ